MTPSGSFSWTSDDISLEVNRGSSEMTVILVMGEEEEFEKKGKGVGLCRNMFKNTWERLPA
jgi:hypothetical protein